MSANTDDDAQRRSELTVDHQENPLEVILRHQVGIDSHHVGAVLDVAVVGVVNSAWRNSPVENWHAGNGPLSGGDMLMALTESPRTC